MRSSSRPPTFSAERLCAKLAAQEEKRNKKKSTKLVGMVFLGF